MCVCAPQYTLTHPNAPQTPLTTTHNHSTTHNDSQSLAIIQATHENTTANTHTHTHCKYTHYHFRNAEQIKEITMTASGGAEETIQPPATGRCIESLPSPHLKPKELNT